MNLQNQTIYFYVYPSAFQNPGGGEILLLKTKEYLEKLGVRVRLFDLWNDRLREGDLLHVFGSVKEALGLMEVAKSKGVMIVHSPIIWYNWQSALRISYSWRERLLCTLRQAIKSLVPAVPSGRKKMIQLADLVLAGSEMEAGQIERYFLIPRSRIKVVTYGAEERFEKTGKELFESKYGLRDFVLTVGRIEPRKNQLNLIRAMKQINRALVIIGGPVSHHQGYYEQCRRESGSNVRFLGHLPPDSEELRSAYAACDVFVLATWFETPGLAALEASLAGAKIVITREGSTREYFKDFVDYVNPADVGDISNKIQFALNRSKTEELKNHVRQNYLWQSTAKKTFEAYQFVASQPSLKQEELVRP